MKTVQFKYFSGEQELNGAYPMKREIVRAKFAQGTIIKYDDFSLLVGTIHGKIAQDWLPVTRKIAFNTTGSGHKCDARCRGAKGHDCECSCGGKHHGIDRN